MEGKMAVEGGEWWWQEVGVVVEEEMRVLFYFCLFIFCIEIRRVYLGAFIYLFCV